ncbi:MAG: FtsH protease activity modulator HflK, partial [Gammaproteobacteria bacterium]|nr:FtsH protease activity modulator HflK [Gammaproteobacteria bacterium]
TEVRSLKHDAEMLTEDENIVKVKNLSVQYVIGDVKKYLLAVKDPEISLRHATESAIRHVVGSKEMNGVITTDRAEIADEVFERIQLYMDNYGTGIFVTEINIEETSYPDAVRPAVDDVIRAKEDKERLRNEADAYANKVVPEARGQAQRQLEQAEGYRQRVISQATGEAERFNKLYAEYRKAPEVTRERIYIDTLESVMSSSTKIMIDVEGGNNLIYLPLDKIVQQGTVGGSDDDLRVMLEKLKAEIDKRSSATRDNDRRPGRR